MAIKQKKVMKFFVGITLGMMFVTMFFSCGSDDKASSGSCDITGKYEHYSGNFTWDWLLEFREDKTVWQAGQMYYTNWKTVENCTMIEVFDVANNQPLEAEIKIVKYTGDTILLEGYLGGLYTRVE